MKNIIIAIILLLPTQYIYAQGSYSTAAQGAISPSVASMSYGKYADTPINPSNGTMGFGIPLFSLSDGALSHSVSLSYHTGGMRIAELASEVGLGWHLNAGGVISRTVRGLPDDDDNGYFEKGADLFGYIQAPEARDVADGKLDAEPDIFFYNVGGMTGKFVYDKLGDIKMIPKSSVQIEKTHNGNGELTQFKLIATDGTEYYFGNTYIQTTLVGNQDKYNDTWFLYKISSFDGKHEINFSYAPNNYRYFVKSDCHVTKYYDGGQKQAENTCDNAQFQSVKINGYILSSISTPTQTQSISFSASNRIDLHIHDGMTGLKYDNVSLTNGSKCVKYELSQSYFYDYDYQYDVTAKRLKLDKIQKKSCTSSDEEEPYEFTYIGDKFFEPNLSSDSLQFFPKHNSKRIDHWGYYNGATINDNLDALIPFSTIPTITGNHILSYGTANRDSDEPSMLIGMLHKITYPTKGYTQLNYEANRYADYEVNQQQLFSLETCTSIGGASCCGNILKTHTQVLTQAMISDGAMHLTIQNDGMDVNCTTGYNATQVTIEDTNGNYIGAFSTNIFTNGTQTVTKNLSDFTNLVADNPYKFTLTSTEARGALEVIYSPNFIEKFAGGVRIKDISTHDGIDTNNDIKRSFTYTSDNGNPSTRLINKPTYAFIVDKSNDGSSGRTALFASTGVLPLSGSEGSHLYYTQVSEYFNGNGYKKYNLFFEQHPANNIPDYPAKGSMFIAKNGALHKEKVYKEDGTIERTSNTIDYVLNNTYSNISGVMYASARTKTYNGSSVIDNVTSAPYSMRTGIYRPDGATVVQDGITQTTTYTYHSDGNLVLSPIKVSTTNSDGKVTESETTYSIDYEGESSIKQYFLDHNMIGIPYKSQKYVDGELLNGSKTLYGFFSNYPRSASGAILNRAAFPDS